MSRSWESHNKLPPAMFLNKQNFMINSHKQSLHYIQDTLQNASLHLPYSQFVGLYEKIFIQCVSKCEVENSEKVYLPFLVGLTKLFKPTFEIQVRLILLDAKIAVQGQDEESVKKLNKVKHLLVDTQLEYLLPKLFLLEAKMFENQKNPNLQYKALKKTVDFCESFGVQYLNEKQEIRKQIAHCFVIGYFELYKLKKQISPKQAEDFLLKALSSCQNNFSQESKIYQWLNQTYKNQISVRTNIDKLSYQIGHSKAITEIMESQIQKNMFLSGFYSWEEQRLVVQVIKDKNCELKIISESEVSVKLDIEKINQLKESRSWVQFVNGEANILEEELIKVLDGKQDHTAATRIGLKTVERQKIVTKGDVSSSSSEGGSFISKEDFNFIRRLGRTQSAKRQES